MSQPICWICNCYHYKIFWGKIIALPSQTSEEWTKGFQSYHSICSKSIPSCSHCRRMSCVRPERLFLLLCCDLKPSQELLQRKQLPLSGLLGGKSVRTGERREDKSWEDRWFRGQLIQLQAQPALGCVEQGCSAAAFCCSLCCWDLTVPAHAFHKHLLCQHWLQELPGFSLSFNPIRDKSYQRLFGHPLSAGTSCAMSIGRQDGIYAKPGSSESRFSPWEERSETQWHNTTWQPSESLSFIVMVPASSFKDISKVPLMADF